MVGLAATFAKEHFGAADLGDARLNARLLKVGEQLASHPNETFPHRFRDPTELSRMSQMLAAFIGGNLPSLAPVEADEEEEEEEDDEDDDDDDEEDDEDEDDDEDDEDDEEEEHTSEPG